MKLTIDAMPLKDLVERLKRLKKNTFTSLIDVFEGKNLTKKKMRVITEERLDEEFADVLKEM